MQKTRSKTNQAVSTPHPARRIHEEPHDVYGVRGKLAEPTACPSCGALYQNGRWCWDAPPPHAHEVTCPACRRIQDHYPAGVVTLLGSFVAPHRAEIEGLILNVEAREKAEHPLKRIIGIEAEGDGLRVATTSSKLARAIGEALFHAYRGELEKSFLQDENLVRVRWERN